MTESESFFEMAPAKLSRRAKKKDRSAQARQFEQTKIKEGLNESLPSLISDTAMTSFLSFLLPATSSVRNFFRFLDSFPSPMEVISSTAAAVDENRWMAWSFSLSLCAQTVSSPFDLRANELNFFFFKKVGDFEGTAPTSYWLTPGIQTLYASPYHSICQHLITWTDIVQRLIRIKLAFLIFLFTVSEV